MSGGDKAAVLKRNALLNSLKELAPRNNVNAIVRKCLYAIAPVYIWQYFSSTGRTRATRYNLLDNLPNTYQVIVATAAHVSRLPQTVILTAISNVLKSCKHRAESKSFRKSHPDQDLEIVHSFDEKNCHDELVTIPDVDIDATDTDDTDIVDE